jgi:hypothetical protein
LSGLAAVGAAGELGRRAQIVNEARVKSMRAAGIINMARVSSHCRLGCYIGSCNMP